MSPGTLHRAAALMRERAEVATPGPWVRYGDDTFVWPGEKGPAANDPILAMGEAHEDSATHIVSWHPAVALAVADWLDETALRWEYVEERELALALALANAYLGETP